jgi:hypothetical protein
LIWATFGVPGSRESSRPEPSPQTREILEEALATEVTAEVEALVGPGAVDGLVHDLPSAGARPAR